MLAVDLEVSSRKWAILEKQIQDFCDHQKRVTRKWLSKRPVFLDKYLECTVNKKDKTRRMQLFFLRCPLLKTMNHEDITNSVKIDGKRCFEFQGISRCGQEFGVHIREETIGKDRKLFLISTFSA